MNRLSAATNEIWSGIVEAANFAIRFYSKIKNFYQRKKSKSNATILAFQSFSNRQESSGTGTIGAQ